MRTRPFVIAVAATAAVGTGLGAVVLPASAQPRTLVVTLAGGRTMTVTVSVPPGTPVSQIRIPGVSLPIVSVSDVTPPTVTHTPTQPQTEPTPTQTQPHPQTTLKPPSSVGKKPSTKGSEKQKPSKPGGKGGTKTK